MPENVKPLSRKYCNFPPAFSFFCAVYHFIYLSGPAVY